MKFLRYPGYAAILAAALLTGFILFAPWHEAGRYALDIARLEASLRGYYVTYDSLESAGIFPPAYAVMGLDIEGPMARVNVPAVTVKVFPLSSLFARGASISAVFSGAAVNYIPNNSLNLTAGEMELTAGRDAITLRNARIDGDIRLTGDIVFDVQNRAIVKSTAVLGAPPLIGAVLGSPAFSRYVAPAGQGEWRILENAQSGQ